jgi:ribosomal protein L7/L12
MLSEEIKKLREKEGLSLFEARDIVERRLLFEQIQKIQTIEDVKKTLEMMLHKLYER